MKRTLLLTLSILLLATSANADVFVVAGFKHDATNLAARIHQRTDNNDEPCALILVNTSILNLKVTASNGVVGSVDFKDGYYWVYLSPGTQRISFYKDGFERLNYDLPQQVKSEDTYILTLRYRSTGKSPAGNTMGFVVIKSQPSGANVYVNDTATGTQTPFQNSYNEGYYLFTLKKPLYDDYRGHFNIDPNKTTQLNIKLIPNFGNIDVSTTPEINAKVNIDGVDYKGITPLTISKLAPGTHTIYLTKELYLPYQGSFNISKGKRSQLAITMKANFGTVDIKAHQGDTIFIDDRQVGTGNYQGQLLKGNHIIRVTHLHYYSQSKKVEIASGQNLQETVNLKPKTGTLSIMTEPIGVDILLNDKPMGLSPKYIDSLKVGNYDVKLKKKGYKTIEKQIKILENRTTALKDSLEQGSEKPKLSFYGDITKIRAQMFRVTEDRFNYPDEITIDKNNNIWVANKTGFSVTFIPKGDPNERPIVLKGDQYGFHYPSSIVVDHQNNIWVANSAGFSVTYIPYGNPQADPKVLKGSQYNFNNPKSIAVDHQNNIWVVNSGDKRITIIPKGNPNAKPVELMGNQYGFLFANAITEDHQDNIWVVNWLGNSVTFIPKGDLNEKPIVLKGSQYGFSRPVSIAVDRQDNIWMANLSGNSVTLIPNGDPNAEPIVLKGNQYGFYGPASIDVDHLGNIWVANANGNSVTLIPNGNTNSAPIVLKGNQYEFNAPNAIAVDKENRIWITNGRSNNITILYSEEKIENQVTRIKNTLKKGGGVQISSQPIGAKLYVDGIYKGITPVTVPLGFGNHRFELRKKNYWNFWESKMITKKDNVINFRMELYTNSDDQIDMVFVKGGTFQMGSYTDGSGEKHYGHTVTLSSFYIGKSEVTQKQWTEIMGNNPSRYSGCDNCPVEQVSWYDVMKFIKKLDEKTGKHYRLPTEAEWEYAARGGIKSKGYEYSGSNNLDEVGWYVGNSGTNNSRAHSHPVGQKMPNELGIYDMSGNVWEWCSDWEHYYKKTHQVNPKGPQKGYEKVLRGGSYPFNGNYCTVYGRFSVEPTRPYSYFGFRLALSAP